MKPRAWSAGALVCAVAACVLPARELARGSAGAAGPRALLDALAARFGPIQREPGFEALRPKLARAALVPSRLFDDPAAWTARDGEWREVQLAGTAGSGAYRIGTRAAAAQPAVPGDYRGRLLLRRTAGGRFEWQMDEALAVGYARPVDLADALTALFRQAERSDGAPARAAIAAAFPRTSATLGRLLTLERVLLAHDLDGATRLELAVRLTPDTLRPFAPRYAEFVRRYATPMKLHAVAADATGATWWTLDGADDLWTLHLRVRDGSLVPLAGTADRRIPVWLRVTTDYETKMGIFHVGVEGLVCEVELRRTPQEKGFAARFAAAPDWRLPFLIAPFVRGSLVYPFEAPGSQLAFAAREQATGPTLLTRHFSVRVRESWIVRWLGGMTSGALSEFRAGAELEADRYNRDCLLALRDDLAALLRPR
jgi:hypothetical protein